MSTVVANIISPCVQRGIWTPKNLDNLILLLTADRGISLGAGGVSDWADQSGQGNDYSQPTTAQQPNLVTGPPPLVEFTAANTDRLYRNTIATLSDGYTVGIAGRFRSVGGVSSQTIFHNSSNGGSEGFWLGENISYSAIRQEHMTAGAVTWTAPTTNIERWIFRHTGATALADFCRNGVHETQQALVNNNPPGSNVSGIGSRYGAFPANIDIYAVVACSDRISDADCLLVDRYLQSKLP
jgi:hypothetical protein